MSLRARAKSAIKEGPSSSRRPRPHNLTPPPHHHLSSSSSSSSSSALSQALAGTASLAKLLPTGTLLAFQLLTPVFTQPRLLRPRRAPPHPRAPPPPRPLLLPRLLHRLHPHPLPPAASTTASPPPRGLLLFDYPPAPDDAPDTSRYRLRPVDFVHAALSVLVFGAVALRDANVLGCFYPSPRGPRPRGARRFAPRRRPPLQLALRRLPHHAPRHRLPPLHRPRPLLFQLNRPSNLSGSNLEETKKFFGLKEHKQPNTSMFWPI
uniref:Uncharacterized protein n=1 Tax=Ananas comosus var. bracteatus TaxID=296719 RepID=A0A6V7Q6P4_ANACO|nr:unnamed protein product [Ananas comosus var. bracteatus]